MKDAHHKRTLCVCGPLDGEHVNIDRHDFFWRQEEAFNYRVTYRLPFPDEPQGFWRLKERFTGRYAAELKEARRKEMADMQAHVADQQRRTVRYYRHTYVIDGQGRTAFVCEGHDVNEAIKPLILDGIRLGDPSEMTEVILENE